MTTEVFFGVLAVCFMVASRSMYLHSVFKGRTKPHAFSWLIWCTISSIGFAAQFLEGGGAGSWARGFGAFSCGCVMVLALFKGEKDITRGDWITLAIALSTIPLWIITETPVWSVIIVCFIDTVGYIPTVRKAWVKPHEELAIGYIVSGTGAGLSIIALENYTLATWLYPAVLTTTNIGMGLYLTLMRKKRPLSPVTEDDLPGMDDLATAVSPEQADG